MASVLIIDDEPDVLLLLEMTLQLADPPMRDVCTASDVRRGYQMWVDRRPDVVVVDRRLPDGDGLELARRILADAPDQTVILFSAECDQHLHAVAVGAGLADCVGKSDYHRLPELVIEASARSAKR